MKNMKTKTAQLIAVSLAILMTMIGLTIPQTAMAQKAESHTQTTPGELQGLSAATSRSSVDEMRLKEKMAQESKSQLASRSDANQMTAPGNDMFNSAMVLPSSSGGVSGTNIDATYEAGEPNATAGDRTVWYEWTAPSNLSMTFEILGGGSLTDSIIVVYDGSTLNTLSTIAYNDDIGIGYLSRVTFIAQAGTSYHIQVLGFTSSVGTFSLSYQINRAESSKQLNFDGASGSNTSDFAVFRSSNGYWYIRMNNATGNVLAQRWGAIADVIYPGDFDGDGSTDIGVWRPGTGIFYALKSSNGTLLSVQWGQNGDRPVQGDFDGDDKSDFAVFRPTNGTFYVLKSTNGQLISKQFGQNGDHIASGDFDGDGMTDFAVQRTVGINHVFYVLRSSDNQVTAQPFGFFSDLAVPGDFDGDGKSDIAVYRGGSNFYALRSSDGGLLAVQWGVPGDYFVPGDYVGDAKSDVTVFRPSTGAFYTFNADANTLSVTLWGTGGDIPIGYSNVY